MAPHERWNSLPVPTEFGGPRTAPRLYDGNKHERDDKDRHGEPAPVIAWRADRFRIQR